MAMQAATKKDIIINENSRKGPKQTSKESELILRKNQLNEELNYIKKKIVEKEDEKSKLDAELKRLQDDKEEKETLFRSIKSKLQYTTEKPLLSARNKLQHDLSIHNHSAAGERRIVSEIDKLQRNLNEIPRLTEAKENLDKVCDAHGTVLRTFQNIRHDLYLMRNTKRKYLSDLAEIRGLLPAPPRRPQSFSHSPTTPSPPAIWMPSSSLQPKLTHEPPSLLSPVKETSSQTVASISTTLQDFPQLPERQMSPVQSNICDEAVIDATPNCFSSSPPLVSDVVKNQSESKLEKESVVVPSNTTRVDKSSSVPVVVGVPNNQALEKGPDVDDKALCQSMISALNSLPVPKTANLHQSVGTSDTSSSAPAPVVRKKSNRFKYGITLPANIFCGLSILNIPIPCSWSKVTETKNLLHQYLMRFNSTPALETSDIGSRVFTRTISTTSTAADSAFSELTIDPSRPVSPTGTPTSSSLTSPFYNFLYPPTTTQPGMVTTPTHTKQPMSLALDGHTSPAFAQDQDNPPTDKGIEYDSFSSLSD